MKNKRNEIIIIIGLIISVVASIFFYSKSKTIVTTDEIGYEETASVNYKVHLNDKKYYNTEFLDEGMQYISSIVDYINVDYRYKAVFDKKFDYTITKKVLADVKIVDNDNADKVIYTKQDIIKNQTVKSSDINVEDTIKIDFSNYNRLANEFKTNYAISANCSLVVSYYVYYESTDGNIKQNKILNVQIPLSQQMITVTKSQDINNRSIYLGKTNEATINKLMLTVSLIFVVVSVILIFALLSELRKQRKLVSRYDRFIKKLLRDYDSYITESNNTNYNLDKPVIKVSTFKELLDVRNNVEKAIIYVRIDNDTSKFLIIDNEVYDYTVTRAEIEK